MASLVQEESGLGVPGRGQVEGAGAQGQTRRGPRGQVYTFD